MRLLRRAWAGWKRVAFWIGERQATLIYTILYFVLIGPIALLRRPFTDPLGQRWRGRHSFWLPRAPLAGTLDEARQQ